MKLKDFAPEKIYSYEELKNFNRNMLEGEKKLINSNKAQSIASFFSCHKDLEKRLRETDIFGYPATAIFASNNICNGLCNQSSRLFAMTSQIEGIQVATALDKSIAFDIYKEYTKDWRVAHHTWVEFEIDGKTKVLDFTSQMAYDKDDYYSIKCIDDSQVMKQGMSKIILQELKNDSFITIASQIADMIDYPGTLLNSYEDLINYHVLNRTGSYEDLNYFENEIIMAKNKLIKNGLSRYFISQAYLVSFLKEYDAYEFEKFNNPIKKILKDNLNEIIEMNYDEDYNLNSKDLKILEKVYPRTKEYEKVINEQYQGPNESLEASFEELGI